MANQKNSVLTTISLPPKLVATLADQIAKTVMDRLRTTRKSKASSTRKKLTKLGGTLFLDTSAIIDGRILDVARLGFLSGTVIIPEFILSELKHIADSEETLRRNKGRRGLDVLSEFKKVKGIKVVVLSEEPEFSKDKDVDDQLLAITRLYKGKLITSDFNLNKKAKVLGITVLNVNELVNVLKTVALPGEELSVSIVAQGKVSGQGVGYLSDGTMIVVEEGAPFVGRTIDVMVSRTIQTAAGRMLFTKVKSSDE